MYRVKVEENLGAIVYVEEKFPFPGVKVSSLGTSRIRLTACFSLRAHTFFPKGIGVSYLIGDLRRKSCT